MLCDFGCCLSSMESVGTLFIYYYYYCLVLPFRRELVHLGSGCRFLTSILWALVSMSVLFQSPHSTTQPCPMCVPSGWCLGDGLSLSWTLSCYAGYDYVCSCVAWQWAQGFINNFMGLIFQVPFSLWFLYMFRPLGDSSFWYLPQKAVTLFALLCCAPPHPPTSVFASGPGAGRTQREKSNGFGLFFWGM